jgi:7-cyano-7-deazaguanine synthase
VTNADIEHQAGAFDDGDHGQAVCIYSGGMDSFTLVNQLRIRCVLHSCLSFNYGQKHMKELGYAMRVCQELGVPHRTIDLSSLTPILSASALTGDTPMPEGHYAEENMKLTVVPNRNMIMLSIAIAYAVNQGLEEVYFGAHAGDHTIYPDCRPEFVERMDLLAQTANWHKVRVCAPYLDMDKGDILAIGYRLGLDYAKSWTCYAGRDKACGQCGSCQERLEGFAKIGKTDPLEYEA